MKHAILVVGLGFGDEGKGSIVDYLCRKHESKLVVRFNGGAQAAHNVVTSDGKHHCFAQWGSGTLAGADTFLSQYMVVNPIFMHAEGDHLIELGVEDAFQKMHIDQDAILTTPFHIALNHIRETVRKNKHGTCGMGIGETVDWSLKYPTSTLRMRDILDLDTFKSKVLRIRKLASDTADSLVIGALDSISRWSPSMDVIHSDEVEERFIQDTQRLLDRGVEISFRLHSRLSEAYNRSSTVIFEGAQGALLDEEWGFHPHTTWSDCTFNNALKLLKFSGVGKVTKLGVTRAYHTRHGAGPLPSCEPAYGKLDIDIRDHNKGAQGWQGDFRVGFFDFVMARYARLVVEGVDQVAVNHLDQIGEGPQTVCIGHNFMGTTLYRIRFGMDFRTYKELEKMSLDAGEEDCPPIQSMVMPIYTTLKDTNRLLSGISQAFKAPVTIKSYGPTAEDKCQI